MLQDFNEPLQSTFMQQIERGRNQQHQEPRRTIDNHYQINRTMRKAEDQKNIIRNSIDRDSLLYGLSKFKNLQQVRLMRVEDEVDTGWARFLNKYSGYNYTEEYKAEDWPRSCEHAARTLSWALLRSDNKYLSRFSSRFMDPSVTNLFLCSASLTMLCLGLEPFSIFLNCHPSQKPRC